jgi:hypothetical protein
MLVAELLAGQGQFPDVLETVRGSLLDTNTTHVQYSETNRTLKLVCNEDEYSIYIHSLVTISLSHLMRHSISVFLGCALMYLQEGGGGGGGGWVKVGVGGGRKPGWGTRGWDGRR